jgi:predicted MFS family arabinose efflux permease
LVEPDQLETANGRQYAAEVVANTFLGPPIGGFLFAAAIATPFLIDSASYLISAVLIASLAGNFRPSRRGSEAADADPEPRRSLRSEIAEGVRWLRRHRLLRTLAILLGALNFASSMGMAVTVLFAQEILGLDDTGFGILLASMTVGSIIGALFGARIARGLGPGRALVTAAVLCAGSEAAVGLMSHAIAVVPLFWISGLFGTVWNVITVSLRQQIIPDRLLGRVNSVYRFLGWGSMPLGALAGGLVANAFGLRWAFLLGGVVVAAVLIPSLPAITTKAIEQARIEAGVNPAAD